ncbi:reverse transcriptase domain-containing protein [Tanacetum coccineum]
MFNSTLTGNARVWFDDLPPESIDSYDDLKKAFLENYLQQKKRIKDPIEIQNIKQQERESTEDFVKRYKLESRDVKGSSECMRISGFVHGITNPELIKRLHDKILKIVNEMIRVTTSFLRGEVAVSIHERKKMFPPWKQHEGNQNQNFKKGGFRNQQRSERKQDRFSLLTKTPKEILALDKGKFKASPPMKTLVEKRNHAKFCEFHGEVGHNTDKCMHLKKQIEEMLKAGKLSHLIKELKQNNEKEKPKVTKKGKTSGKDKALAILIVQPWERVARKRITQSFSPNPEMFFPHLGEDERTEGPMIIEVEIGDLDEFLVVRSPIPPYNGTYWKPGVKKIAKQSLSAARKLVPLECAMVSRHEGATSATKPIIEERVKVAINPEYPKETVMIGSTLIEGGRNKLCGLLQRNLEIFAWKPADLTGVPRHIAEHLLNVQEGYAYKGYHQIQMAKEDEEKTAFITSQGIFCYTKPPFSLRNAGATYQRLVDKAFHKQIGRNLELYVDDLVIKSRTEDEIVRNIEETFKTLREINMKLNPKNCAPYAKGTNGKEELIVYLAAAIKTVSAVLMTEMEAKQMPIYFVSRALRGPELNYTSMEKLVQALVHANTLMEEEEELPEPWILFTYGSSCTDGSGARVILTNPEGMEFTYALRFMFDATNNEAEYEALIDGLRIAEQMGMKNLQANVDSRLVANQVNITYVAKEADMIRYLEKVKALIGSFKVFTIKQIPRSENKKVDALSKIASTSFAHLSKQVLVEELKEKSISEVEVLAVVKEEGDTWMTPIFKYLAEETQPTDMKKERAIRRKSWRFSVINETLYKKSFLGPWLRYVGPLQANYVLREIHEGSCSMHAGTRSVMAKALRTSYYWPTMHKDTRTLIRACQDCQVHKHILRNPQQKLTLITSPWAFYK